MDRKKYITQVTITGSLVNFFLLVFKFLAGIFGNSSAMIADAAHSLSDFASDIIVLLCIRVAEKPEDEDHAYGHGKFETLASVAIGLILLASGLGLLWDGICKILDHMKGDALKNPGWLALGAALLSIIIKEGLYHYTMAAARKAQSEALRTNAWHHRSDSLSSIAAVVGIGGAMLGGGSWVILDPLAACLISIFIMIMAIALMKPGIEELMEKSLPEEDKEQIIKIIRQTPQVRGFHHLRTRRIGLNRAVEAHIKLDGSLTLAEAHDAASLIEAHIKEKLGANTHIGIHMEPAKAHPDGK